MKNLKKLPTKQLEKFSNIFTQLGLVLVLFIVYVTLEHQTEQKTIPISDVYEPQMYYLEPDKDVIFVKEKKAKPKVKPVKSNPTILENIKKGDNNIIETIVEPQKDEVPEFIDIDKVKVIDLSGEDDPFVEDVDFINIQNAPVFKGCEGLSQKENKLCFERKMKQFVQRNFDIDAAQEKGLDLGRYKIYTQFVIDDKGEVVDVKIRTPHKSLEKEANRIIKKLPKFKPGKQNNRTVKVKYSLPISFSIQ